MSRSKGNRTELKAVKELEKQGFLVYRVKGSTIFNKNVDIFSIFDIFCIKPNISRLIQVKTNKKPNLKIFEDFKIKYPQFNVEVWVWYDYSGFKIFECG